MSEIEELAMKWFRAKQRLDRLRNLEDENCRSCDGWGDINDGDVCPSCDGSGTKMGRKVDDLTDQLDHAQKALETACSYIADDARSDWHESEPESEPDLTDYLDD